MTTAGWQRSILNSRLSIGKVVRRNPGLKPKRDGAFAEAYADARKLAAVETGLPASMFPDTPPFTREEAETETYLPARISWSKDQLETATAGQGMDGPSRT